MLGVAEADDRVLRVGYEVAVGQHRALGQAGRAARVEDPGEGVGVDRGGWVAAAGAVGVAELGEGNAALGRVRLRTRVDQVLDRVAGVRQGAAGVEERVVDQQRLGPRVAEDELELLGREADVEVVEHAAAARDAQPGHEVRGGVEHQHARDVPGAQAQLAEAGVECGSACAQLGVGPARVAVADGFAVALLAGGSLEYGSQVLAHISPVSPDGLRCRPDDIPLRARRGGPLHSGAMRRGRFTAAIAVAVVAIPGAAQAASLYTGPGPRPGPDILYEKRAQAPQLENAPGGPWAAEPLLVSGASAYRSGEFLYQDFLYDDHGARTGGPGDPAAVGANSFSLPNGSYTYPTAPGYAGNAADFVELRVKPLASTHGLPRHAATRSRTRPPPRSRSPSARRPRRRAPSRRARTSGRPRTSSSPCTRARVRASLPTS